MKIALYGGTFDPIHKGHIHVIDRILEEEFVDKVVVVPNNQNPLKKDKPLFSKEVRLDKICTELLGTHDTYLDVSQLFSDECFWTIDLIIKYRELIGYDDELFYAIGSDCLLNFDKYKEWKRILDLVKIIVVPRPKYDGNKFLKKYPEYENRIYILSNLLDEGIDISSTQLRKKMKKK